MANTSLLGFQIHIPLGFENTHIFVSRQTPPCLGFQRHIPAKFEDPHLFDAICSKKIKVLFVLTYLYTEQGLMTDLFFGLKVTVHDRPKFADGRLDLYVGGGIEFSFFNPRSDQNEVQNAFGHEMGKWGIFDQGAGLNAMGGLGYDVARTEHGKWTAFIEGEFRTLMPLHIYFETRAGVAWRWGS